MHAVIFNDLEGYLSGHLPPSALDRFQAHLNNCGECRSAVDAMRASSALLGMLKPATTAEPPPGFVAQVMQNVPAERVAPFWRWFTDYGFARRVVFASLLTLAVLGTVLVSREQAYAPNPTTPQAVMADASDSPNANQMLATLANYEP